MTVTKRHCLTLDEIKAVQFECKKCGAKVALPLQSIRSIVNNCPDCGDEWFKAMSVKSDVRGALAEFIKSIPKLNEYAPEMGCIFSIEIKGEANGQEK
jgi:predicted  nucleic acid-binding Zn-ribbon protein